LVKQDIWKILKLNSQQVKKYLLNFKTTKNEEEEGLFGPPKPHTIDDYMAHQIDGSDKVTNPPLIPVPYTKA
jgi:hypothetical protein